MRIVAGKLKGRPIITPRGRATRPTSDRARETIFNILAHASWAPSLNGAHVIDLFAGTGALGLEAISRGAHFCLFVDSDPKACRIIRQNIDALALSDVTRIQRRSAIALGRYTEETASGYDLVFLDPPYHKGLARPALETLRQGGWLSPHAVILIETGADEQTTLEGWDLHADRTVGAARLQFVTLTAAS